MCGIAGYICFDKYRPSHKEIVELHTSVQHRGMEAAGLGFVDDNDNFAIAKGPHSAEELHRKRKVQEFLAEIPSHLIMHTRAPTKGDPDDNANNHPVEFGDWLVTHNGHIRNDEGIFRHYRVDRFAEVDSASIPVILEKETDVADALRRVNGTWAVAALCRKPFKLIIGREVNPVAFALDMKRGILFWASELRALAEVFKFEDHMFTYCGFSFRKDTRWKYWELSRETTYEVDFGGLQEKFETKYDYSKAPSTITTWPGNWQDRYMDKDYSPPALPSNLNRASHQSWRRTTFVPPYARIVNMRGKVVAVKCPGENCEMIVSTAWLLKTENLCPHCNMTLRGWSKETEAR